MAPRAKHKCKLCNYETYSPKYLTAHKLKMHYKMSKTEFTCALCKATFGRVTNFQWHIRNNLCRSKLPIPMVNEVQSQSQFKDNQPEESGIVNVPVRQPVQGSCVNYSNQTAEPTGEYSEEDTCLNVRLQLRKSSKEKNQKNSSETTESADQNTGMGDFEDNFGEMGVQVRPASRMSSRIQKAKIGSAESFDKDETAGEVNTENYDLGLQFRPESRMSSKPAHEEEPSCSVIQSEPILRWNTQLTPTIKLERLKTDENAKMIAKWLLKQNVQPELSNTLVITVEGDVENNLQSTSNPSKRFNCSRCAKSFSFKRNLNTHVKNFHKNPLSFKCVLCKRVFNTQHLLDLHTELLHSSIRLFQCSVCDMLFQNEREIRAHKSQSRFCLQTKINANWSLPGPSASEVPNPVGSNEIEMPNCSNVQAGCSTVERVFLRRRRANQTQRDEKKEINEQEKNSSDDSNVSNETHGSISLSKSIKKPETKGKQMKKSRLLHKCTLCKEAFFSKQLLNHHIQHLHSYFRPFECGTCNRSFINKRGLQLHQIRCSKSESNGNKPITSPAEKSNEPSSSKILETFARDETEIPRSSSEVKAGCSSVILKSEHPDSKMTNEINDQEDNSSEDVNLEMVRRISDSESIKKPKITRRRMKKPPSNKIFVKIRKNSSEEKKTPIKIYQCDSCNYVSVNRANLRQHKKVHLKNKPVRKPPLKKRVISCHMCEYKTSMSNVLKQHLWYTHKEENVGLKIHKCELCEFKTIVRTDLRRHMKGKHNKIMGVPCDKCKQEFPSFQDMRNHQWKHLKESTSCE